MIYIVLMKCSVYMHTETRKLGNLQLSGFKDMTKIVQVDRYYIFSIWLDLRGTLYSCRIREVCCCQ